MIIPCFNEELYIERCVSLANEVLSDICSEYEIIVVDDGSTDKSITIANELLIKYPSLKVISHEKNLGLGAAIRTGFSNANYNTLLYTDMDLPFDFNELRNIIPLSKQAPYIHAIREGGKEGCVRRFVSFVYNSLLRIIFDIRVTDINFALKLLSKDIVEKIDLKSNGSFIDAEIYLKSFFLGVEIKTIPIKYTPREEGESRLFSLSNIFYILKELYSLLPELYRYKNMPQDFTKKINEENY